MDGCAEVEAGGVETAARARDVRPHVRQVALGRGLHLAELTPERHDSAPQRQQARMLRAEVLIEGLQDNRYNNENNMKTIERNRTMGPAT